MREHLVVVISTLNSQYIHSSLAPWCLLSGVESYCEEGIAAQVIEGTINEKLEDIAQNIIHQKPDVIGFSCYIWNITATKELIRLIKNQLPKVIVVFGGPEVSYNAQEILKNEPLVDYVVSGEGEKPFALLLNAILKNQSTQGIEGVSYREDFDIVIASPNTPNDEPPSPYTKHYFENLNGRIAYLETSRGCPYSCAFCLSGRCGGVRYFDLERAKVEMIQLANSGTQTVKLVDRTFNANRKRATELFQFIIENYGKTIPQGVCFHFEVAGDLFDEETIALLATAPIGSIQLEIGLQSFNSKTLAAINRKTNIEKLKENIRRIVENKNMHIHIDLIAGLPYEDFNSFQGSFNIAYSLNPNMLQLGFLKLLHGASMREEPDKYPCIYSDLPPYEVIQTPFMSENELLVLHYTEDALDRLYNSGRFPRTLDFLLKQMKCTPFDLFREFGEYAHKQGTKGISLDDYTALVYYYFSAKPEIDQRILRDIMVCDRLTTNASGKLPEVLQIKDENLKKVVKQTEKEKGLQSSKGIRRSYAILYSENCLAYVDYKDNNPVTGEYTLQKIPLKIKA